MDDLSLEKLGKIIEGILFAAGGVVTLEQIQKAIPEVDKTHLKTALAQLKTYYQNRGIQLKEVANGFRLETAPELAPYIRRIKHKSSFRLSRAALETLAIIAYNQPITRAEIEALRGVDSAQAIKNLLEKGLIKIAGRKDIPGRPLLYTTTPRFLEIFGLKSLKELPDLKELEERITDEPA